LRLIPIEDIHYLEADQKYVAVHHAAGQDLIDEPLKSLESEFADRFVRVHRSVLVAVSAIERVDRDKEGKSHVILREGSQHGGKALLLQHFKPYLKVGLPYYSPPTQTWEPALQWSDHQQVTLSYLQQGLQALMRTFQADEQIWQAVGLDSDILQAALTQLAGVIVSYPVNWPDTYSFNVREAILAAQLVTEPGQIFFIEDTIAALLPELQGMKYQTLNVSIGHRDDQTDAAHSVWQGDTLVMSAGANTTELALVNLPKDLSDLTYQDFAMRSYHYAGNAIDQDVVCQLLYPLISQLIGSPDALAGGASVVSSNDWQTLLADVDPITWAESLNLEDLELPQPAEPDRQNRQRLQHRLGNSPLGHGLLAAANQLKLILQAQDSFTLNLGGYSQLISRQALERQIFVPYIQRLNRELNILLSQTGVSIEAINQVVCTGGTASLPAIARWLRQKLPNATIVQDTYRSDRPPTCSRVAYGLAHLPLSPQVLDLPRQQYSDYFLLLELLRIFPNQPLPLQGILQLLEHRGINTQACKLHILALLEGHLPPGLVPTEQDGDLLTVASRELPDYQMIKAAPLFRKQSNQIYVPDVEQCNRLRTYFKTIMVNTHQQLEEPLIANLQIT
ncbi:MAG: hypothetical protein F6K19_49370, partial [Cyanothece sp. SIO1E1]|nr:hypothetical protein [Cyanothece sp. SIO1E1]